jgi:regulator of protease activity HflC (stomatin/prohibitin superfamily)
MNYALIILLIIGVFILLSSFFYSETANLCYHRTLRRFHSVRQSGLQLKIPLIDRVAGRVNLKIQQLDVIIETKTKDNVFVKLKVSVQSWLSRKQFMMLL